MKRLLMLTSLLSLSLGCAVVPQGAQEWPTPISVRSQNRSEVDVYLLCGNRNAIWLGVVSEKGTAAFEMPAGQANCVRDLNFFLVVKNSGRGYWVGPLRPQGSAHIDLMIEKYAGLSVARLGGTR